MHDILEAMTRSPEDTTTYYLDLRQGGVVAWDSQLDIEHEDEIALAIEADPARYVEVPRLDAPGAKSEQAMGGGEGPRAGGRPESEADGRSAQQAVLVERATGWLAELGIQPQYELRSSTRTHHSPWGRHDLQLLDLLLLGAPRAEPQLFEGRIIRRVTAASSAQARAVFESLAAQISAYHGAAPEQRASDAELRFDLGRMHLRSEGRVVQLSVDYGAPSSSLELG
jgi:hypothetical protein